MRLINTTPIISFIICLFSVTSQSQSIPSYWMNFYSSGDYYETKQKNVDKIEVKVSSFYSSGQQYGEKWVYTIKSPTLITGEYARNGELKTKFSYEFDSFSRRSKNTINTLVPAIGWQKETIAYHYQNGHKVSELHYDNKLQLVRAVSFEYNPHPFLTKLFITEANSNLLSSETAEYAPDSRSYQYKVFNAYGELVSESTNFSNTDTTQNLINANGDYIKIKWPTADPAKNIVHLFEYEYDKQGNWVTRKRYLATNSTKQLQSLAIRKIKYRKQ